MDVTNTFLHGDLFEVHMTLPLAYSKVGGRVEPLTLPVLSDRIEE